MLKTRKEIDTWIYNNYRRLSKPEYMFSLDNRSQSIEEFYNAKLRVLVVFLSPGSRRTVSNTFVAICKQSRMYVNKEDVFLDYCYFPEFDNLDILDKEGVPYIFGTISHAPINDFDIMMVSLSTFHESVNYPRMLMKSEIPLTIEQREEREDVLLERIEEFGLNKEDYWWYLELRKFGTATHSGFGLGFERMIMYLTGISNIRDVLPFPRTVGTLEN